MAYIGNVPAEKYVSLAAQHFTVSATTGYTLSNSVTNENEIALFINNVRQQPGSSYSYTAVGTTLTLSAATAGTDTMYCVYLGKAVGTISPPDNSVNSAKIVDGSVTNTDLAGSIADAKITDLAGNKLTGVVFAKGNGASTDGKITLNCSQNTHGVSIQSPAHAANATYTLTLPVNDGNADEALKTDGAGVLSWGAAGGPSLGSGSELLRTNSSQINQNITIPSGTNASSVGPISVGASYSVAVNGVWAII